MLYDSLRESRSPLYLQVAEILRQRLERGLWPSGTLLPTLNELVEEFSVAKITVRQAVMLLVNEGYLESKRGKGTIVIARPEETQKLNVETKLSSLVEMYSGDTPTLVLLEDRSAALPESDQVGKLAVDGYHLLKRTHARKSKPYCVISLYFATNIFKRHEQALRNQLALPVLFNAIDVDIKHAKQTLIVRKCDFETAALLNISVGEPVAEVRRIMRDTDGTIIYLADVIYRGDFIKLEMDLLA
jgi:GntR family transcriptional regulator